MPAIGPERSTVLPHPTYRFAWPETKREVEPLDRFSRSLDQPLKSHRGVPWTGLGVLPREDRRLAGIAPPEASPVEVLFSPVGLICITVTSSFGLSCWFYYRARERGPGWKKGGRGALGPSQRARFHPQKQPRRRAARTLITIITTGISRSNSRTTSAHRHRLQHRPRCPFQQGLALAGS